MKSYIELLKPTYACRVQVYNAGRAKPEFHFLVRHYQTQ
jgi:hypothetical protein